MTNLFDGNLLKPLSFEEGEIEIFIRDNKCGLCGSHLFAKHAPERKYTATCPKHGAIMEHSHVSNYQADQAEQDRLIGKSELREPGLIKSAKEIIEELGF